MWRVGKILKLRVSITITVMIEKVSATLEHTLMAQKTAPIFEKPPKNK